METLKSQGGALATKVRTAGTGGTTPVATIAVDDVVGWRVGQSIVVHTSTGAHTEVITAIVSTPGSESFTFGTDEIDFDVAVGDDITGTEYLATGECDEAGAGLVEFAELTAPFLSIPNYLILTRQRITRSTLLDLVSYSEAELAKRSKRNLEQMLLYGDGTDPTQLQGFLTHSAIASQTDLWSSMNVGDNRADAVLWAACKIPGSPMVKAVMHKKDWFWIQTQKGSDGHYTNQQVGPVAITDTPARKAIGSVEVVVSDKIAQSTALVLAPENASDLVPGTNSTITWGFINDQFIKGKTTAKLDADWAHAITDTQAFRKVTFDSAPS
jgi:HK97 family phage major capsid protein